jgi:hypothetical protein
MELIIATLILVVLAILASNHGTDTRDDRPNW